MAAEPAEATAAEREAALALLREYHRANPEDVPPGDRDADLLRIFEAAVTAGHDLWPRQVAALLPGRDVLDVGCGNTFYGAVTRALGARSYTGTEPRLNLGKRAFRSRRTKTWVTLDASLALVARTIPRVAYVTPADLDPEARFDLALMHTVTEHLLDIEAVFADTARALRPGGELWFLHDNFSAWAGHHMAPHSPRAIKPGDPEQAAYIDWRHLSYVPAPDHPFVTNLNRIRLRDLRAVTEAHFEVLSWEPVPDEQAVAERLTPAILRGLPGYGRDELLTRHLICHARRR